MAWTILNPNAGINITGLPLENTISPSVDEVVFFDASAGANRKTPIQNITTIPDGSITTAKLADANVTTAKIADDAVTNDKLSLAANAAEIKKALNADNDPPIFACRAWVNFDGTPTTPLIRASGNLSSVTRNGVGDFTVNFETAMPDANYGVSGAASNFQSHGISIVSLSSANFRFRTADDTGSSSGSWLQNQPIITVIISR
jgi:hypothetical protein